MAARAFFPLLYAACISISASAGTWIQVTNTAPSATSAVDTMLLLSDGTVMVTAGNNGNGNGWSRLKPDIHGSFAGGTWSAMAGMHDSRLYFSSDVMVNGQVFVAGGEYGTGTNRAEVYDPVSDNWTMVKTPPNVTSGKFFDAISKILPNGDVLVAPVVSSPFGSTDIYNFAANNFTVGPADQHNYYQDEASWVKLPDCSILMIDPFGTNSERYIPSLNRWVLDSNVPVFLWDSQSEMGPAFLLPNGNAIFFGASGHTAIYTPSGTTNAGTWIAGPDMPNGLGMPDAPGAMMANGKILCALGTPGTFNAPTSFCEYDYASNSFTMVGNPNANSYPPYITRMLALPDGNILFSWSNLRLYIYQPGGTPLAAGKPVINSVTTNSDGSFQLAGTQLNGISEGAAYGDDAQMDSNYPIIYVTNGTSVYYLKTFNWSSTDVMTSNRVITTDFVIPSGVPAGTYSLFVSANGISSDPVPFTITTISTNPSTVFLTNNDVAPDTSFNSGLHWSDGQAPAGMNNYVVSGCDLCTPSTYVEMTTFRGGSLYLTNGGALRIKNPLKGDTTTIGAMTGRALVMNGGIVSDWAGQPETLGGYVILNNGSNIFDPQSTALTAGGNISGSGSLTVDSPNGNTGGTVIIPKPIGYTGGTIINAADTLQFIGTGTIGSNTLVFSNTLGHGYGTLDLNGTGQTIANISGTGGVISNSLGTAATLTVGISNVTSVIGDGGGTFAGNIRSGASGPIPLVKMGTGTWMLSGNSTVSSVTVGLTNNATPMTNGSITVSAGGSLTVGNGAGDSISVTGGNMTGTSQGVLDVSSASSFSANVGTVQVGVGASSTTGSFGTLLLGTNNSIVASSSVVIGDYTVFIQTSTQQSINTAANGTTTISTPLFIVGGRRCNASFTLGNGATINLGNFSNRTSLGVGHVALFGLNNIGASSLSGVADFSGGILNAFLNSLVIGTKCSSTGAGSETGTMIIGANAANHLDVNGTGNVVLIGTNFTATTAIGILTISNLDATSSIVSSDNHTAVLLGANSGATGILNLNGGRLTLTTTGPAIAGGAGTSVVNIASCILKAGASSASFITNITTATLNSGGVTFDTSSNSITVAQNFNGIGGITKLNSGILTLSKTNGYTGNTVILAGTLALSGQGSFANSANIVISNAATLDASGRANQTLTLNGGQTLRGSGNIIGNLVGSNSSIINPGDSIGTLTVSSNVTLGGILVMELNRTNAQTCDRLMSTSGIVTGGGQLTVTNLGGVLQLGDHFQLFNSAIGGFASVNLPALSSGLTWMNKLTVDGSIQVMVVSTVPTNIVTLVQGGIVTLSWPADHTGWRLQSKTNSLAGTNWVDILDANQTNQINIIIDPANPAVFFRLTYP
jgi:autotransporter-associated beta strand protein